MHISSLLPLGLSILLAGCVAQASQQNVEDPPLWGRVDCQRLADRPDLEIEFEQAKTICLSRGQAAAVAGTAAIPVGRGLGGAMASGIERGITANQIGTATINGCMGEMGYLFKPKSEHLAMCEAVKERQRLADAAAKPKAKTPLPRR